MSDIRWKWYIEIVRRMGNCGLNYWRICHCKLKSRWDEVIFRNHSTLWHPWHRHHFILSSSSALLLFWDKSTGNRGLRTEAYTFAVFVAVNRNLIAIMMTYFQKSFDHCDKPGKGLISLYLHQKPLLLFKISWWGIADRGPRSEGFALEVFVIGGLDFPPQAVRSYEHPRSLNWTIQ